MARGQGNGLSAQEAALVRAMVARGGLNDQQILAYFTRPGRTINHARIAGVRVGALHAGVPAASTAELEAFLARWPEFEQATGLHPEDDELVIKAREAMLNAIQVYNNPRALFRSECFIVLAVIAWTYLMHWYYRTQGTDYRLLKTDGTPLMTRYNAVKHWELETCLSQKTCPLDEAVKKNLAYLIVIRHEIEHQMTRRIDDVLSAKVQACCMNFNNALKALVIPRCGIDKEMYFAIQLSGIEREQRNMLLKDMGLPKNLLAAQEAFERDLPAEITANEQYAWRVTLIHKKTNAKGAADEVVEFVRPGSRLDEDIQRVLRVEVEKAKFRPTDIVDEVKNAGFADFTMYHHTKLMKAKNSKKEGTPYGNFVDRKKTDWRWYQAWLDEVIRHCAAHPPPPSKGAEAWSKLPVP